jgi:hypothetical protein
MKPVKIYSEGATFNAVFKLFLWIVVLVLVLIWGLLIVSGIVIVGLITLSMTMIIILFAFWFFLDMKFIVTDREVIATFGPYKYKVPFEDIDQVRILPGSKLHWYYGLGLRRWPGHIGFLSQMKDSVIVERKSEKNLVMTTREPEKFVKLVRERMKK